MERNVESDIVTNNDRLMNYNHTDNFDLKVMLGN